MAVLCLMKNMSISTHTPLAGRDEYTIADIDGLVISTHTPLAGRDCELFK